MSGHGNAALYRWYCKFNCLYWNNELPADTLIYWEPNVPNDASAETCPVYEVAQDKYKITMDPAIQALPRYWKIVLIHEMAHIAKWRTNPKHQHGKVFWTEIERVIARGAYKKLL